MSIPVPITSLQFSILRPSFDHIVQDFDSPCFLSEQYIGPSVQHSPEQDLGVFGERELFGRVKKVMESLES